jgi:hypothetical protein
MHRGVRLHGQNACSVVDTITSGFKLLFLHLLMLKVVSMVTFSEVLHTAAKKLRHIKTP